MEEKKRILSTKAMINYACGIFGIQLLIGYINGYQSQFYTSMFGANLMIVAAIILVAKFVSAIADPFFGNLIDRSNFKSGKMRPFIAITAIPFAVITTVMFIYIPFKSDAGMYVYITFTTIVWNVVMSLADISSQGMLALLSPVAEERNGAAGLANVLKSVGLAANGLLVPVICVITGSGGGIGKLEYLIAALAMGILGGGMFMLIYFGNKEVVPTMSHRMTLREMGRELKNNKMLMIVFLTFMLGFGRNMAMGIGVQASAVLLRDGVTVPIIGYMAGENLPWLIGLTAAISSMVSIVFVPAINKRWGEKKTFFVFGLYGFIVCAISFVLYATGVSALRTLWAILVYQFFVGFSFGPNGLLPMIMVSDIVDYQEWKTGNRTEGTQFAILSMSNKISNALSVAIGIFICGAAGYNAKAVVDGTIVISDKMQTIVFAAYILIPGICMLLSMIPMIWYKIDSKTKEEMRSFLEKKRVSEAADDELEVAFATEGGSETGENE